MARPLSPFCRHLGEAKYRGRQLQAATERVLAAAVGVAGLTASPDELAREIAAARSQLDLLERTAAEWGGQVSVGPRRSESTRLEIRDFLAKP